jgi:uncharacterized protein
MSARQTCVATGVCLLVVSLLSAGQMVESARRMELGSRRDLALSVATKIDRVSHFLSLNRPREWAGDLLDRDLRSHDTSDPLAVPTTPTIDPNTTTSSVPPTTTAPATTTEPTLLLEVTTTVATGGTQPVGSATTTRSNSTTTATATAAIAPRDGVPRRTPTAEAPLVMYVGGDSMARELGESLLALTAATGVVDADLEFRISTGLSRPDFFDWPARLQAEATERPMEVAVVLFGANDGQNLEVTGTVFGFGTPEWIDEYHRRVGIAMDVLYAEGRDVVWVGMPNCRSASYSEKLRIMNQVYADEAAKRPWVTYLDTYTMFSDADGNYADYLPGDDGELVLMRQGDGIHWSRAGGDRVAQAALDIVGASWNLGPGA